MTAEAPAPERCNVSGCDHADDDNLLVCDSCSRPTCHAHARKHEHFALCFTCGLKEVKALALAAGLAQIVVSKMFTASITASSAVEQLIAIAEEVDTWEVS